MMQGRRCGWESEEGKGVGNGAPLRVCWDVLLPDGPYRCPRAKQAKQHCPQSRRAILI
jgi:hypothetical protein